jgi:hypothetical protein
MPTAATQAPPAQLHSAPTLQAMPSTLSNRRLVVESAASCVCVCVCVCSRTEMRCLLAQWGAPAAINNWNQQPQQQQQWDQSQGGWAHQQQQQQQQWGGQQQGWSVLRNMSQRPTENCAVSLILGTSNSNNGAISSNSGTNSSNGNNKLRKCTAKHNQRNFTPHSSTSMTDEFTLPKGLLVLLSLPSFLSLTQSRFVFT